MLVLGLSGCANPAQIEAEHLQAAGRPEEALSALQRGLSLDPENASLRSYALRLRTDTMNIWLAEAFRLLAQGQLDEAARLLDRAQALEPNSARAAEMLRAVQTERRLREVQSEAEALFARGQATAALRMADEALRTNPRHDGLLALRRQILVAQRDVQLKAAQLGLAEQRPVSLDFRDAGLRQVLDVVSRYSGLNFVLDKDIRSDLRVTIYLKNVRVEDALDLLVSTHQLARKVLDERTVLIYPNTPDKQHEYQEQVIRVYYLANAEAKGAAAFLKAMLKVKDPFVDDRSNMLSLRESPETMALAERLIGLYDTQEPEVLLELEVLEVSSTRLTELGVKLPSSVGLSLLPASSGGTLTMDQLRRVGQDRIGVSLGSATLNLRREVNDAQVLANPRVRAKNREKAKVLIGDKVPIVTTTTGQAGFVGDSVSYIDVGLKLDLEPTIYANDEVMIRLSLEVSSLASQIKTASGTTAYQISTRNAGTALRLKDGETQLLAGLLSREERSSGTRVPGIGDLPLLNRIFGSQLDDGSRTELVLSITPRIVRNLRQMDPSETELWVGTEAYTRLRQVGGRVAPENLPSSRAAKLPTTAGVQVQLAPGSTAEASPGEAAPPAGVASGPPAANSEALPANQVSLRWQAPAQVKAGQPFSLVLVGEVSGALKGLSFGLQTEPDRLRLLQPKAGAFWAAQGAPVNITSAANERSGRIDIGLLRSEGKLLTGTGVLVELTVMATKPGRLDLSAPQLNMIGADTNPPTVLPPEPVSIEVLP
ncbi:type IV pilus secretin PilQ [Roseateles sp. BYS78W]|uniref:Type IV pilus secretin PilQ n=1 Tax=Pelomonas candidula TaxID=3299025 RepID=A0ABW7HFT5_9BURK